MSIEPKVHAAQVAIIRVLLFTPSAPFAALQKASELTSDHFNFHLKQLLDQKLIEKTDKNHYRLTSKGKEYANRFDTDAREVERQPKVAVCLMVMREDGRYIAQQRLKQPYFGYWGRPTGKIRWGETILQAAARELMEETGLTADLQFHSVYHKMDFNKATGELLEDKIFFTVTGTNPRGDMVEEFEGGRNAWMTHEEYSGQEKSFAHTHADKPVAHVGIIEARHDYDPKHY